MILSVCRRRHDPNVQSSTGPHDQLKAHNYVTITSMIRSSKNRLKINKWRKCHLSLCDFFSFFAQFPWTKLQLMNKYEQGVSKSWGGFHVWVSYPFKDFTHFKDFALETGCAGVHSAWRALNSALESGLMSSPSPAPRSRDGIRAADGHWQMTSPEASSTGSGFRNFFRSL